MKNRQWMAGLSMLLLSQLGAAQESGVPHTAGGVGIEERNAMQAARPAYVPDVALSSSTQASLREAPSA